MAKRKFRIVKRENNFPVLGVCEYCNAEFAADPETIGRPRMHTPTSKNNSSRTNAAAGCQPKRGADREQRRAWERRRQGDDETSRDVSRPLLLSLLDGGGVAKCSSQRETTTMLATARSVVCSIGLHFPGSAVRTQNAQPFPSPLRLGYQQMPSRSEPSGRASLL